MERTLKTKGPKGRIHILDALRGLAVGLMVLHHLFYSYRFIFGGKIDLYTPFLEIAIVFVCLFFSLSGVSSHLSRSNYKRALKALTVAALISAVTYFYGPSYFISFGVIHCLGSCMLIYAFFGKFTDRLFGQFTPLVWVILFVLARIFWGGITTVPGLFMFGYYRSGFYSADYYPIIPWIFMFFFGGSVARYIIAGRFPQWFYDYRCPFLEWIGTRALLIFVLHQPVIVGLLFIISKVVPIA